MGTRVLAFFSRHLKRLVLGVGVVALVGLVALTIFNIVVSWGLTETDWLFVLFYTLSVFVAYGIGWGWEIANG